jgi:hypothetical protein
MGSTVACDLLSAKYCSQLAVRIHFGTHHHADKQEGTQLDFTAWVESLNSLAQVLAGFGFVTVLLAYVKHAAERRSWENYQQHVGQRTDELIRVHEMHPNELNENQWRYEVERMLTES